MGDDQQASASQTGENTTFEVIGAKIEGIIRTLDGSFVERESHARLCLLCLLSGQHALLLGPPGTAKSRLARAVAGAVADTRYFEYLLSRFTHPDELFGPVSIPGLKEEDYRRLTEGFLPKAHVAFLDEVFKANSAILNSLLTLINERLFHHGRHVDAAPLVSVIGASNEAPEPSGPLAALYDRFLVRLGVAPVADEDAFLKVAFGELGSPDIAAEHKLTIADIEAVREMASRVTADETTRGLMADVRRGLMEASVDASDRRWRWAVDLIRVAALTSGRQSVEPIDLLLLEHCFGDPLENDAAVRGVIREALSNVVDVQGHKRTLLNQWHHLTDGPSEKPGPNTVGDTFDAAKTRRIAALDAFRASLDLAEDALDVQRDALLAQSEATLWIPEVPPSLFAGFVSARRDLVGLGRLEASYRETLTTFSLYETVLPQAHDAQRTSMRPGTTLLPEDVPLWIGGPGDAPEHWVPVNSDGMLLVEHRNVLAKELERRLQRKTFLGKGGSGGGGDQAGPKWHEQVAHATLDDGTLFTVLGRSGRPHDEVVERLLSGAPEGAKSALSALLEWLRGTRAKRLPDPPSPSL